MISVELPHRSQIQVFYPKTCHNGFGYSLMLKTGLTIGKRSFGICIMGFGFGFCYDVPGTLYGVPREGLK
jgi:hypothetical protein